MSPLRPPRPVDTDHELLVRAAFGNRAETLDSWQRWNARTGGVEHHDHASYRVIPLLYRHFDALGIDDPQLPLLKGVYRHTWYGNQRLASAFGHAIAALEGVGIVTLALGGIPLCQLHYEDMGARPIGDLSVAVHYEQAEVAIHTLAEMGWRCDPVVARRALAIDHAVLLVRSDGRRLGLHWRVLAPPGPDHEFWTRSAPFALREATTRALSPTDQLLQVMVGGGAPYEEPVGWICDARIILHRQRAALDWDALCDRAASHQVGARLLFGLEHLRTTFGVPVPTATLRALRDQPVPAAERLRRWALDRPITHGAEYVQLWNAWSRRRHEPRHRGQPGSFLQFLCDTWDLPTTSALAGRLGSKTLHLARTGTSSPMRREAATSSPISTERRPRN